MAKDPAVLIYFDKWISSTNGMTAQSRAWYMDLLFYQYDKGKVPNDLDELAGICRVRPSEYENFKQVLEQVLKQKFKQDERGGYENEHASEIMRKREQFKEKRSKSGNIGVIIKLFNTLNGFENIDFQKLKDHLYSLSINDIETLKDKQMLMQMLTQNSKLYINVDEDEDEDIIIDSNTSLIKKDKNKIPEFEEFFEYAKTLENYSTGLDFTIKAKYDSWVENNWKDGNGNKIKNWKTKLRNTWPHLKPIHKPKDDGRISAKDYFNNLRNGTGLPQNENKFIE